MIQPSAVVDPTTTPEPTTDPEVTPTPTPEPTPTPTPEPVVTPEPIPADNAEILALLQSQLDLQTAAFCIIALALAFLIVSKF